MTATCPVCSAPQDEGLVCHACTTTLERELGDVPAIVADLDVTLSRQARIGAGGKGGLASERTPAHLGAMQAADDLGNTLTTWARDVCGNGWPTVRLDAGAHLSAVALLSHIPEIRRHPAASELHDELCDAIRQARRAVDRPADRQYLGPCMFVEEESGQTCYEEIYARPGASEARCKVCGITHEVAERQAAMLKQAEDMLFTASDAAKLLGQVADTAVTEDRIRGLLRRGTRLQFRPGTNTFRLGDLLDILRDDSKKRAEKQSA